MVMRKVYLRPIRSPSPAEEQRAERPHEEAGGESEQREDESCRGIDAGEELRREDRRERAVDVEVVPLENRAERRGEDDEAFLARHRSFFTRYRSCYRGHGRPSLELSVVGDSRRKFDASPDSPATSLVLRGARGLCATGLTLKV